MESTSPELIESVRRASAADRRNLFDLIVDWELEDCRQKLKRLKRAGVAPVAVENLTAAGKHLKLRGKAAHLALVQCHKLRGVD